MDYGSPSRPPFAIYDPISCCWKTLLSSEDADSNKSNPTWPAAGTTRNGSAFEHPRWVPLIDEPGASSSPGGPATTRPGSLKLLPTPQARDGGHSVGLDDAVSVLTPSRSQVVLFPTPRASDGTKGSLNQQGSKGDLMLTSAIARLAKHPAVPSEDLPEAA